MTSLRVFVGPDAEPEIVDAVRAGGGTPADGAGAADAIVWLGAPDALVPLLHDGVRWVQLPNAGVERWLEGGLIGGASGDAAGGAVAGGGAERVWTSAAGAYADTVAEHTLALVLAGLRRLPECARAQAWDRSLEGRSLRGATVAIVGAGAIGRALIGLLAPFGARVIAVTLRGAPVPGAAETLPAARLAEVWPRADVVVLAAPATDATRHVVDTAVLRALPSHAWIVNVGRGALVDTDALVQALAAGEIAGAALDVTEPEPLPSDHPLWREPRALITPHVANPDAAIHTALAAFVADNVARRREGRELRGVIDVARGY
ncbi:D-isomer specific 2-hydroxyacid dehydrogenase family protein [Conexibacter woesei]|uniref:D-isomer specific 2-hydroxyacid dehydrogenase NAD-binding protein n=1 Tax=Conexibacter woesei (strain DSM 14684 / CCUG 47730 / CIP 108061 / JCM 11494 / NBRC 100937 / ID131577) TaxID=469383 RepID=D3FCS7_CONWI|nr:D-isomer specific 2-hydroxyacid dehydrogenase family protein [Conexibacter woesei]ADB51439.1 D-isomer specific 2-hydroxyacid dehydrogenase NAD-binding protein [Conexibacter woesei DSM 14684]